MSTLFLTVSEFISSNNRRVYVHDGEFHADDVTAAALVQLAWWDVDIVRTRQLPETCLAIDVGEGPYDHHGKAASRDPKLDYPHCGVSKLCCDPAFAADLPRKFGPIGYEYLFKKYIIPVARQDNGEELRPGEVNYFAWVNPMNPSWVSRESQDSRFDKAVEMAKAVLLAAFEEAEAYERGVTLLEEAKASGKKWTKIPAGLPGWEEVLASSNVIYVTFEDNGTHYIQCVPNPGAPFSQKVPLPKEWAGLRDNTLTAETGIAGSVFCHNARFICGFKTAEGAAKALELLLQ